MKVSLGARALAAVSSCALALALAGAAAGCSDQKKQVVSVGDAGLEDSVEKKAALGGKLGAAVRAAESAQPVSSARAADGPPENGVFGPGEADKAQRPGAPAKVEVISEGKAPGFTFALAPASEQKEIASVTVRLQQVVLPVEYSLALKLDKPKDDKKDAPAAASYRVVGKVLAVGLPPQVQRDLGDKLAKLKGVEIHYTLSAAGVSDAGFAMPKDADPTLGDLVVKGLLDNIALASPPLPSKPIGVGGYWMVTDRTSALGVDVVRYRVYTVDKIEGGVASLSLQTRQYAVKSDLDFGSLGAGQKMSLTRFDSSGASKIDWAANAIVTPRGETSVRAVFVGTVGQGQQGGLQTDLVGRFAIDTGDKKR